jgi:hypothetical protein
LESLSCDPPVYSFIVVIGSFSTAEFLKFFFSHNVRFSIP